MDFSYLRNIPVFEDMAPEDLATINQVTIERKYKKSGIIFMEGESGEGFHYIKSGKVKIVKSSADGREHIINILGPGEVFAEVLLFSNEVYPATAVALEDSLIGIIRNDKLEDILLSHPPIALHIIRVMSRKIRFIQTKVKALAFSDSYAKVAQALEALVRRYGVKTSRGLEIDVDMTRQDVANLAGTTRETVSRVFSIMKKDRILDGDERRMVILDPDGLRRYYEDQL